MDNNLVVSRDPATTDANHVFSLENGMLKVEIPNSAGNGTDYELIDGVLSVNSGFTGRLTAEYAFATAPTREIDFEYDHNGLRTQKKVVENGITTIYDYTLHGKLITHLTKRVVDLDGIETSEELHFFYESQGKPAFMEFNGVKYRYACNPQGDIVAIIDSTSNAVIEYRYDAWGELLCFEDDSEMQIGQLNPFRYRGYVYDVETSLYWLRSRYYSPVNKRFICADTHLGHIGILSSDAYAYCKNNVVMCSDPSGKWPKWSEILFVVRHPIVASKIGKVS